jgi:hypothetical protein
MYPKSFKYLDLPELTILLKYFALWKLSRRIKKHNTGTTNSVDEFSILLEVSEKNEGSKFGSHVDIWKEINK